MEKAYRNQEIFMREQVRTRRAEIRQDIKGNKDRRDMLSQLIYANEFDNEKYPLDEDEIVRITIDIFRSFYQIDFQLGNFFILFVAGHGTCYFCMTVNYK